MSNAALASQPQPGRRAGRAPESRRRDPGHPRRPTAREPHPAHAKASLLDGMHGIGFDLTSEDGAVAVTFGIAGARRAGCDDLLLSGLGKRCDPLFLAMGNDRNISASPSESPSASIARYSARRSNRTTTRWTNPPAKDRG